jgi:membrane fusion protein (multidrug efflux system)
VKQGDLLFQLRPLRTKEARDDKKERPLVSINAPFDGMIDRLPYQRGSVVLKGETLTNLFDNSMMRAYFNVPETRYFEYMAGVKQYKEDSKVELVLADGSKFQQLGKLGTIGAVFNAGMIAFRADFPNPDRLLRHGQTGTVLISHLQKDAIVIPLKATFQVLDRRYVWVVDKDDVAHRREIVVQNELDDRFVIKKGVGVGDKIVIEGVGRVRDGNKVKY